jgi:hypothetical protein
MAKAVVSVNVPGYSLLYDAQTNNLYRCSTVAEKSIVQWQNKALILGAADDQVLICAFSPMIPHQ